MQIKDNKHNYLIDKGSYTSPIYVSSRHLLPIQEIEYSATRKNSGYDPENVHMSKLSKIKNIDDPVFRLSSAPSSKNETYPYSIYGEGHKSLKNFQKNKNRIINRVKSKIDWDINEHRPELKIIVPIIKPQPDTNVYLCMKLYYHSYDFDTLKHYYCSFLFSDIPFSTSEYENICDIIGIDMPNFTEDTEINNNAKSINKNVDYDSIKDGLFNNKYISGIDDYESQYVISENINIFDHKSNLIAENRVLEPKEYIPLDILRNTQIKINGNNFNLYNIETKETY